MDFTVGEIEEILFKSFPKSDAFDWDRPGLSVGNRDNKVIKIAFGLDQCVANVQLAKENDCNLLITHHPPFIKEAPNEFGPTQQALAQGAGRTLFEAAINDIAMIAIHTNADRSKAIRNRFAELLNCKCVSNFEYLLDSRFSADSLGLGGIYITPSATTLREFALVCNDAFNTQAKIFGNLDTQINTFAIMNGSCHDYAVYEQCIKAGVNCLVTGESSYHFCVDAQPHLPVIVLGHDKSELPIVDCLIDTILDAGITQSEIVDLRDLYQSWQTI
ncbi:MAG: Nif3-like dinuclear metal center hexameric protein [Coriobacteriales bacterium]|nr:Nif3-like dinuclear metal center hexameric protein [Coriobacteriales bacterium]